ncbi:MAG: hypothetical protein ABIZ81_06650 [Opitutaceae bacterium]
MITHKSSSLSALLAVGALLFSSIAFAADKPVVSASAKAAYPLTTCLVSDEKLGGSMGEPIDYLYKQPGKPDRLVLFCCKDCIEEFEKEPAKYLKKLDDATAAKNKASPPARKS